VIVGQHPSSRSYTLPIALLSVHSIYFRDHIARINATESKDHTASKKRKLASFNDDGNAEETEVVVKEEDDKHTEKDAMKENKEEEEKIIRLPAVDPAIFGLFLKFIYKDVYPSNVDARTVPSNLHLFSRTDSPNVTASTPTPPLASQHPPLKTGPHAYNQATPPANHMPSPRPSPTNMPPPPLPHALMQPQAIPPSILAWLLAQRLGALSFMNHTIQHIYQAIGTHFALTPTLMDHVWRETTPTPPSTLLSTSTGTSTTVLTPSPLRRLLLHILTSYWSNPRPQNPNAIILRCISGSQAHFSTGLKEAWDRLFAAHEDLRSEFIHGLQGGGGALLSVGAYFASSAPVVLGMGAAGRAEVVRGKGKDGGGRVEGDCVVVKEEVDDEVRGLGSVKGIGA
jgi:hypothetical protein